MRATLLVLTFALVAAPARAQSTDSRWAPWLGCWALATENLRDGNTADPRRSARPATVDDGAPRVCVTRADSGARFETTVGVQPASAQTIVADGVSRPMSDAECTGTTRTQWSKSGVRLFTSSEVRCQGEAEQRRVSGLSLLTPNGDWVDIQTVALGSRETISVKRYYRDQASPRSAFPGVATSVFTLDEVKDATGKVSNAAIEAALVETGAGYNLTAKNLKDLDASGVPERVIELIVALSYPEKFVVHRAAHAVPQPRSIYRDPFGVGWSYGYPYYYDRYYGSPYFYEPFGWRGYSVFDTGVVYIVDAGGGSAGPVPNGPGRAVNGQGYTRVAPRQTFADSVVSVDPGSRSAGSSSSGSSSGATVSSSGGYSSGGSSSSGSSGSGSSSSSGGGGSSSGGSSDSGGRTAVPR